MNALSISGFRDWSISILTSSYDSTILIPFMVKIMFSLSKPAYPECSALCFLQNEVMYCIRTHPYRAEIETLLPFVLTLVILDSLPSRMARATILLVLSWASALLKSGLLLSANTELLITAAASSATSFMISFGFSMLQM